MIDTAGLPENPGCYLYADADGRIIYVGKAKNLRKRVSSYFTKKDHDAKTRSLVARIVSVAVVVTDTETEAFLLENTLIKKHQPKYNIDLKDAKRYAWIELTKEEFPRLVIARRATGDGTYFGPFVSAAERDHVIKVAKKIFHLRTCKKLPKRPCLRRHMQSCSAPCTGTISPAEYGENVKKATLLLKGKSTELLDELRREMAVRSAGEEYERALVLRNEIAAIEHLAERQHVERQRTYDQDVIACQVTEGRVYLTAFNVERGTLANKQEFTFEVGEDFFEEFLVQYYSEREPPAELVVEQATDPALAEFLSVKKGRQVDIVVPQRGEKRQLLELAKKNLEIAFFRDTLKGAELGAALGMPHAPSVIECFDISHLSGTAMVGSMVQFRDGKPDKSGYRRFKIRTVEGIDDFASIAEVVKRRYQRLTDEHAPFPDLIIIDGGKGQLAAAQESLAALGATAQPVIAIAKREEEIYTPGDTLPLRLNRKSIALRYVQEIRDEAHRFAITYNRLLRKKKVIS
ncbi:excinuclease ABC subunit UvrC [Methanoregula sp.]|uniref:excinuclease ABC subunit UvrC n=1 Tax=Methanoregula sp. TaxID=2052170 RepID=UPI002CEE841E|nr:excinuclease ABC subunit UvrC [Methanoregula sp.]HVP97349.1 excinuclease ABC subunit UvrC [Methanoregula sp.]